MLSNIAYMSVLLVALLVWLIGVPVGFWILAAVYPVRMRRLLRKSASFDQGTPFLAPVTQLARHRRPAPVARPHKLT
jgi:hypothetical protein